MHRRNTTESFGKLTNSSGTLANPFRYAAREFDAEAGLYYNRARYLDPNTGRFLSEDPLLLTLADTFSGYGYAFNSPVNYFDPLGLCPWQVRIRPLKGIPQRLQNIPGDLGADVNPTNLYFYNSQTGQSIGLGPVQNSVWQSVPGQWETHEHPSENPNDKLFKPVPDHLCKCVDKTLKKPGKPPDYCSLGHPHGTQKPCTNCWNWALQVLQGCKSKDTQ